MALRHPRWIGSSAMKRFRHWALVAVSFTHEAASLEESEGQIRDMSVMDWRHETTVNTITEVEVKPDEWRVIDAEQLALFMAEEEEG
jgi:hypothetical protein